MEVVPYFLSIITTVVALYWSVREYRRKPGTPTPGIFRYFRYHEVLDASVSRAKAGSAGKRPARPELTGFPVSSQLKPRTPTYRPPTSSPRGR